MALEHYVPLAFYDEAISAPRRQYARQSPNMSAALDSLAYRKQARGSMTLGQELDPRRNALNAWRLALATGVILWHSFLTTGHHIPFMPARQLLSEVFVDGFFAISGYLITSSWVRTRGFVTTSPLEVCAYSPGSGSASWSSRSSSHRSV